MIKIKMVRNGWILEDKTDEEFTQRYAFEYIDDFRNGEKSEVEAFVRLLWVLNDLYGPTTSRYSAHRVAIRIEKGDKCDDHLDENESIERPDPSSTGGINN